MYLLQFNEINDIYKKKLVNFCQFIFFGHVNKKILIICDISLYACKAIL